MERWVDPRIALLEKYPGYDISELDHLIDNEGLEAKYKPEPMRVLFETPSGFAFFDIDPGYLYDIGGDYTGLETIWVHCVDKESAGMGIACICDEAAEELMWGLQNMLHDLVPEEKSEFGKQHRKYHSQKLLAYLRKNVPDREIKPEMINGRIALLASFMRKCDVPSKEYSESCHSVDNHLKERSSLRTDHWDTVTHATALMRLIGETVLMPDKMFTEDERKKIAEGVGKYDDKIIKENVQTIYNGAIKLNRMKFTKRRELVVLLDKANEACEGAPKSEEVLAQPSPVFSPKGSCQEEEADGGGQRKKLKVKDGEGDTVQSGATVD